MDKRDTLWNECLAAIRGRVGQHIYDVWFSPVICESYDDKRNQVLLAVPNRYVYEYIEEIHSEMMKEILGVVFGKGVTLNYRISEPSVPSPAVIREEKGGIPHVSVRDARQRLENGLKYFLKTETPQWLPCYDDVAQWLSDNKGRGLLCIGAPGLGKTVICRDILPFLLGQENVVSVTAMEMGQRIDELLKARCVIIDNLGSEPSVSETVNYRRRTPFFELCDAAERRGILLVITSNLSTNRINNPLYPSSIQERYGNAVLDRLYTITKPVLFKGQSMRPKPE